MLCDILEVSKSCYYGWINNPINKRQQQKEMLDPIIKNVFNEHKNRYGANRIHHELKANGISCSRTRISARMKAMQLVAKAKRKFKATTDSRHDKPKVELVHDENYET